jgi:hypothetical protein
MMTLANGQKNIGDWKNDLYGGQGTGAMTESQGTVSITGGKGLMTLTNGKRYALIFGVDQKIVKIHYIDG